MYTKKHRSIQSTNQNKRPFFDTTLYKLYKTKQDIICPDLKSNKLAIASQHNLKVAYNCVSYCYIDWELKFYKFTFLNSQILKCQKILKIIKFAVMSYNMKLEQFLELTCKPTNQMNWCHCLPLQCQNPLYCPFFPLHGSLRIISCTDLVQLVLCGFEKFWLVGCAKNNFKNLVKFMNFYSF